MRTEEDAPKEDGRFRTGGTLTQESVFRNDKPFPYTRRDWNYGAISDVEPVFLPDTLSAPGGQPSHSGCTWFVVRAAGQRK